MLHFQQHNANDCVFHYSWCPRCAFSWFLGLIDLRRTSVNSKQVSVEGQLNLSKKCHDRMMLCCDVCSCPADVQIILPCVALGFDMVRSEGPEEP